MVERPKSHVFSSIPYCLALNHNTHRPLRSYGMLHKSLSLQEIRLPSKCYSELRASAGAGSVVLTVGI
ncbi:uncharacterized protein QC761_0007780 [Podospora bellae-mahoneyi]|uniref:Uncharacterized protein n=1 Tax=Podospora bellae-mahoneyi TaxID=2093777 RepID=A0ABR0FXK0_9PEZI|nr:hypothetical protein QC761_0007780 [Podospora bellae-mahoneyi]